VSQSPADESNRSDAEKYGTAWAAIMQLVRDGKSWSGREKNCCYLNTASSLDGATRFANISHVSGLDFADDSRAIAVVDWDHDGDLDLWFRNRTAPRLRFMANQLDARRRSYVALRLEGTSSNRDGVGAVVEVVPRRSRAPLDADAPRRRLVKSVRAGDLFLSQSSKWLQFGLDGADEIATVTVLWSGRDSGRETFTGVAPGGRYVLKQGSGATDSGERSRDESHHRAAGAVDAARACAGHSAAQDPVPDAVLSRRRRRAEGCEPHPGSAPRAALGR